MSGPSLGEALTALVVDRSPTCPVSRAVDALGSDDGDALRRLIDDSPVGADKISATVRRYGHPLSGKSIQRHRSGHCRCSA